MKRLFVLAIVIFFLQSVIAQKPLGAVIGNISQQENVLSFKTANAEVRIELCSPAIIRYRASWNGIFEQPENWMVVQYKWPKVNMTRSQTNNAFIITTDSLEISIQKADGSMKVHTRNNILLSADVAMGAFQHAEAVGTQKMLQPDEHFFGFGERMDFMDQRGKKVKLDVGRGKGRPHEVGAYNVLEANYCPVPFFMSTKGYGIFLHNSYANEWDMGNTIGHQYQFKAQGGELDYYLIYGPGFGEILNGYTTITGKAPLMPKFALGLHIGTYSGGTWGYEQLTSDAYVLLLAQKLRAMGIAVDVLHLDSVWRIFGKVGGKGATSFEWRPTYRNPKAMFDSLYTMGFSMVGLHVRPRFDNGNTLKLLDTAQQLGFTFPENGKPGEFVNFFDPKAVDWWWEHGVKRVAATGARFLKTDEGSAFGALANESDKTGPVGNDAQRLHNIFPLAYAKAPYEKFQQWNNMRGMNHTREGYAGIQRFPFIFAGDWPSEWQYFGPVIKAGLNIGLSGVGNWAHCMGGFEHVADPELYVRWTQFGLMSPVAHLFGMDHPAYKEPWNYGDEALRIFKKYDSLRYRLIPYLYSHQYEMNKTGMPMMRAMVLYDQQDVNTYEIVDQYMLGGSLMICPVTTKGAKTRSIYLPAGEWYDYHTGEKFAGKQYVHVVTPLDRLPMFVKAGSIIPMQPGMTWVGQRKVDTLTLDVFPGNGSFTLYEDDGNSLDYQKGIFSITTLQIKQANNNCKIEIAKPSGKFKPEMHQYALQVHTNSKPAQVLINGSIMTTGWRYDEPSKTVIIQAMTDNLLSSGIELRW